MDRRSGLNCYYCHVIIVDNSTRLLMRHLRESHDVGYRGIRDSVIVSVYKQGMSKTTLPN